MTKLLNVTLALAGALVLAGAAAAQEQAPEAGRLFEMKDQLTIVLPEGWTVYDQTAAFTGKPSPYGMVHFSAGPVLAPGEKRPTPEALLPVYRGDVPSFFVDRHPAEKGMSCSQLTKKAKSQIERMAGSDPLLSKRPQTSEIKLAGCQALKLEGRGNEGTVEWRIDIRAVSDGKTLYFFHLRSTADNFAKNFGAYEAALATLQLASGPAGASGATAAPAPASAAAEESSYE